VADKEDGKQPEEKAAAAAAARHKHTERLKDKRRAAAGDIRGQCISKHRADTGEFNKDRILVYANELVDELYGRLVRRGYMLRIVGVYLVRTIFSVETREVSFPGLQARRESISSVMIEQLLDRFSFGDSARR
jgi:hypothetical protein